MCLFVWSASGDRFFPGEASNKSHEHYRGLFSLSRNHSSQPDPIRSGPSPQQYSVPAYDSVRDGDLPNAIDKRLEA